MDCHYSSKFANYDGRKYVGPVSNIPNSTISAIARFLKVSHDSFQVFDSKYYDDGVLVLIHYDTKEDPIEGLRGTILFVTMEEYVRMIAPSGPIIEEIGCNFDKEGKISSENFTFDGSCKYAPSFEGLNIRIFKFKGETFFCTYKTLYAANKVWGNSVFFGQMWENDMGMNFDIFPPGTVNSKYCHNFCVVHRDLQYSSRFIKMDKGFVMYFGATETSEFEGHPDEKILEYDIIWPTHSIDKPFVTGALKFENEEDAFDFLKYGFYKKYATMVFKDENEGPFWELNPGEKILVIKDGKYFECCSPGSLKRREMREKSHSAGINTNLNAYFNLLSKVLDGNTGLVVDLSKRTELEYKLLTAEQRKKYCDFFHPIKLKEDTEFPVFFDYITEIPVFPISTPDILKIVTEYYVWLLPPFMREKNNNLLETYYNIVESVSDWIFTFRHNNSKAYISDTVLRNCELDSRIRFEKPISLIYSILHDATKYALDPRNTRGEQSIPDNIRFLTKRRYAHEILFIFQLKMRYDIANAKSQPFGPEYKYLLDNKGNVNAKAVWEENIDKLYPLHKCVTDSIKRCLGNIGDVKISEIELVKVKDVRDTNKNEEKPKRIFKIKYGETYHGSRKCEPTEPSVPVASAPVAKVQEKKERKAVIVRTKI